MSHSPTILLSNGLYFDFANPGQSPFGIGPIARSLSKICRFTGHVKEFYSVAEHSWFVSHLVPSEDALAGLLHDASEAFIGDVSAPLKSLLPDYKAIEARVEAAVFARFGLPERLPTSVKTADLQMLVTEAKQLMPSSGYQDMQRTLSVSPLDLPLRLWTPAQAEKAFFARYYELIGAEAA